MHWVGAEHGGDQYPQRGIRSPHLRRPSVDLLADVDEVAAAKRRFEGAHLEDTTPKGKNVDLARVGLPRPHFGSSVD